MKSTTHRAAVLLLTLCILFSLGSPVLAIGKNDSVLQGTFYFDPHEGGEDVGDLPDTFTYSDDYFATSSYEANMQLAVMSMQLAAASISSCSYDRTDDAYATRSQNVEDLLYQLGFDSIEVNDCYNKKMGEDTMGVAAAYKPLDNDTVLLAIVPRSAGYESEWSGNFNVGSSTEEDGLHVGFKSGRDIALGFAEDYVSDHLTAFSGKTLKVWTVGYSRGAAVANLIGAAVAEGYDFGKTDGASIKASSDHVYAYTFGTPNTVVPTNGTAPHSEIYYGIHNYYAAYDPVAMMPFSTWNFTRYGQDTLLPAAAAAAKTQMLSYLSALNQKVYDIYTQGGGDPDTFTAMAVDLDNLTVVPDLTVGLTQENFFRQRIEYLTTYRVDTRDEYVTDGYEDMLRTLMVLMFGGDGNDMGRLIAAIQADKNKTETLTAVVAYALMQGAAEQYGEKTTVNISDLSGLVMKIFSILSAQGADMSNQAVSEADVDALIDQILVSSETVSLPESEDDQGDSASTGLDLSYSNYAKQFYNAAVPYMQKLLSRCVKDAELDPALQERLKDENGFVKPFIRFISAVAFGTELSTKQKNTNDIELLALLQAGTAATLYVNSGKYMRVHNNEVILSWLHAMEHNYSGAGVIDSFPEEPSQPADTVSYGTFSDLISGAWYQSGVEYVLKNGLMTGVSATSFAPDAALSRAMAVTILWRLSGSPDVNCTLQFSDMCDGEWYTKAINWAANAGITTGYGDGRFGVSDTMTREQMTTILYRYAKYRGYDVSVDEDTNILDYADASAIDTYAVSAIQWACGAGVLSGPSQASGAKLEPKGATTRAQLATMLMRMNDNQ